MLVIGLAICAASMLLAHVVVGAIALLAEKRKWDREQELAKISKELFVAGVFMTVVTVLFFSFE